MTHLGPCIKCVISDSIDGYGRCTNCDRPEATEEEKQKIFKYEREYCKVRHQEGKRNGN
jgi:hypothetical protein